MDAQIDQTERKRIHLIHLVLKLLIIYYLFSIPKNNEIKQKWITAVRRKNWYPSANSVLCSTHFTEECFDRTSLCIVRLRPGSVPSIFPAFPRYLQKSLPKQRPGRKRKFSKSPNEATPGTSRLHDGITHIPPCGIIVENMTSEQDKKECEDLQLISSSMEESTSFTPDRVHRNISTPPKSMERTRDVTSDAVDLKEHNSDIISSNCIKEEKVEVGDYAIYCPDDQQTENTSLHEVENNFSSAVADSNERIRFVVVPEEGTEELKQDNSKPRIGQIHRSPVKKMDINKILKQLNRTKIIELSKSKENVVSVSNQNDSQNSLTESSESIQVRKPVQLKEVNKTSAPKQNILDIINKYISASEESRQEAPPIINVRKQVVTNAVTPLDAKITKMMKPGSNQPNKKVDGRCKLTPNKSEKKFAVGNPKDKNVVILRRTTHKMVPKKPTLLSQSIKQNLGVILAKRPSGIALKPMDNVIVADGSDEENQVQESSNKNACSSNVGEKKISNIQNPVSVPEKVVKQIKASMQNIRKTGMNVIRIDTVNPSTTEDHINKIDIIHKKPQVLNFSTEAKKFKENSENIILENSSNSSTQISSENVFTIVNDLFVNDITNRNTVEVEQNVSNCTSDEQMITSNINEEAAVNDTETQNKSFLNVPPFNFNSVEMLKGYYRQLEEEVAINRASKQWMFENYGHLKGFPGKSVSEITETNSIDGSPTIVTESIPLVNKGLPARNTKLSSGYSSGRIYLRSDRGRTSHNGIAGFQDPYYVIQLEKGLTAKRQQCKALQTKNRRLIERIQTMKAVQKIGGTKPVITRKKHGPCVVCKSTDPHISFHPFPRRTMLREKWLAVIGMQESDLTHTSVICTRHFSNALKFSIGDNTILLDESVPDLYLNSEDMILVETADGLTEPMLLDSAVEEVLDYNKICRVCMKEEEEMSLLNFVYYENKPLVEMLEQCTGLQINKAGDMLPQKICAACVQGTINSYIFVTKCRQTEEILISKLGTTAEDTASQPVTSIQPIAFAVAPEFDVVFDQSKTVSFKKKMFRVDEEPGPPFNCRGCSDSFETRDDLRLHYKRNGRHMRSRFSCPICGKDKLTKEKVRYHVRNHMNVKPFECQLCKKKFSSNMNLKRHLKIHNNEKMFMCEVCGKSFIQHHTLKQHLLVHDRERTTDKELVRNRTAPLPRRKVRIDCPDCGQTLSSKLSLWLHRINKHHYNSEDIAGRPLPKCEVCSHTFGHHSTLTEHMKKHTQERNEECKVCSKRFMNKTTLKFHMMTHNDVRPHKCNQCPKTFKQWGHLQYHLQMHSGLKPFVCTYCNKGFCLKGNLTVHERTHTGETPYICDICNKGFYDSSSMKKHRRSCMEKNLWVKCA